MSDRISKAVADERLAKSGLEAKKAAEKPAENHYGGMYYPGRAAPPPRYGPREGVNIDEGMPDIPRFLRRDKGASGTHSAGPTHKHSTERKTAEYLPHNFVQVDQKIKVTEGVELSDVAQFSPAALGFIEKRVHEAIADALEKYGLIWTSNASEQTRQFVKALVRSTMYRDKAAGKMFAVVEAEEDGR